MDKWSEFLKVTQQLEILSCTDGNRDKWTVNLFSMILYSDEIHYFILESSCKKCIWNSVPKGEYKCGHSKFSKINPLNIH
jgi:hypothetical protein